MRGEEGSNEVKRTQSKVGGVNTSLQRQRRAISRQQDEGPLGRGLRLLTGGRLRQQRGRIITTAIFAVRRRWRAPGSERPVNVCVCAQRGGADSRSGVCVCTSTSHSTAGRLGRYTTRQRQYSSNMAVRPPTVQFGSHRAT